jgi:sucrose-6-phosphate hydrolase SacC (GH32 family)
MGARLSKPRAESAAAGAAAAPELLASSPPVLRAKGRRRSSSAITDRPRFHVAPKEGWVNDPNGPVWVGKTAHL